METEQWQPIWALLLADDPVPNLEIAKWDMTFTNWDNRTHGIKFSLEHQTIKKATQSNGNPSETQTPRRRVPESPEKQLGSVQAFYAPSSMSAIPKWPKSTTC